MGQSDRSLTRGGYGAALLAGEIFAGIHILMCLFMYSAAPDGPPWNYLFLSVEFSAAAVAAVTFLWSFLRSERLGAPDSDRFLTLLRSLRFAAFYCLAAWSVWAVAACFLAVSEGMSSLFHNARYLFYLAASLLILFPLGYALGMERDTRLLRWVYDLGLIFYCLFLLWGFIRFFRGELIFRAFWGKEFDFTVPRPRFGQNQNSTGAYCAFFLIAGIWRLSTAKRNISKALLGLLLVPLFAAFALTESRAAIIACAFCFGVFAGCFVYRHRGKKDLTTVFLAVLAFAAAIGIFLAVYYGCRSALGDLQQMMLAGEETVEEGIGESRELVGENASNLAGRLRVWKAVTECILHDRHLLIHGCSQAATSGTVLQLIGKNYNTHNQFLEILLAQGLPALVFYCVWLVWTAGKSLFLAFSSAGRDGRWILPLPLLFLVIDNLSETMLAGRGHFVGGMFFLIAGMAGGLCAAEKAGPDTR